MYQVLYSNLDAIYAKGLFYVDVLASPSPTPWDKEDYSCRLHYTATATLHFELCLNS